jgi:hypothetical protein
MCGVDKVRVCMSKKGYADTFGSVFAHHIYIDTNPKSPSTSNAGGTFRKTRRYLIGGHMPVIDWLECGHIFPLKVQRKHVLVQDLLICGCT